VKIGWNRLKHLHLLRVQSMVLFLFPLLLHMTANRLFATAQTNGIDAETAQPER
jgi:hypothetical protein